MRKLYLSGFLSVAQTVITIQSEPLLIKELSGGDIGLTARMLANTQGLVGVLGVVVNQIGGKFSDVLGRKRFLTLGPLANILFGLLIFRNSHNRRVVLPLRIVRSILTTFSSTVMLTAALSDVAQGAELGAAISKMGAAVGAGIVITPFVEALFLQRSNSPRTAYLLLSLLGFVHALFVGLSVPETLRRAQRKTLASAMQLSSINPFGFLNVFRRGSVGLQKMVCIQTLQMFLEGKNLSDLVELWKREHLKWTVGESRNFVMIYGTLSILSGVYVTPFFLKNLTARGFTSATNMLNLLGFLLRGAREKSWIFLLAVLPMLPGVNGASATALKSISTDLATAEGFGKGEFSAWTNNLRALAGAVATVLYGNYYSWCKRTGISAGTTFALAGLIGAALPELILRLTKDNEIQRTKVEGA
ncbi:bglX [Symbiodinium pilosum]|uniref:BglX protein n=1 Tax=Symbiodinium pilosum TaxID=2952 RepID=A0A812IYA2_SYMPI|nr:bglX [Symbiodinium pilosum]